MFTLIERELILPHVETSTAGDIELLRLSAGAIVLVTRALNADADGRPIQYAESRFAADRVELKIEND